MTATRLPPHQNADHSDGQRSYLSLRFLWRFVLKDDFRYELSVPIMLTDSPAVRSRRTTGSTAVITPHSTTAPRQGMSREPLIFRRTGMTRSGHETVGDYERGTRLPFSKSDVEPVNDANHVYRTASIKNFDPHFGPWRFEFTGAGDNVQEGLGSYHRRAHHEPGRKSTYQGDRSQGNH